MTQRRGMNRVPTMHSFLSALGQVVQRRMLVSRHHITAHEALPFNDKAVLQQSCVSTAAVPRCLVVWLGHNFGAKMMESSGAPLPLRLRCRTVLF